MMSTTDQDVGLQCIKYLLCIVNSLFVLTGMMIISIGTTLYATYYDFSFFLDSSYFSPAKLLIIIGTMIFVIAFLGCYGALKESTCMVLVFAVSLFLVLFLELSVAVGSYAYHGRITDAIHDRINRTMHQYEKNVEARQAIDFLQSNMYCCGYDGPDDWAGILTNSSNKYKVPNSCCYESESVASCKAIFKEGCYNDLVFLVNRSAIYVVTGAIVVMLLQFSGIVFACVLGKSIRYHKTLRDMHRWQNHETTPNEPDEPLQRSPTSQLHLFM